MNRATRSFVLALLAFVAATWLVCNPRRELASPPPAAAVPGATTTTAAPTTVAPAAPTTPAARAPTSGRGFRTPERLAEHYGKHGAEFTAPSAEAYLALAQALRDAPAGGDVLEIVRPADGVVSRFDRRTGAFLAADADGTIRTFFKPTDGEAYFRRQARRLPR